MLLPDRIRNIGIIAHIDHGKTTLVDAMLRQAGIFRANEQVVERVLDSFDLERERGITILAKNTSIRYGEYKINIVDTPGHADFSGEVERALSMVDGVLLLVDAIDGPMPQTRFVLRKALEGKLKAVVVINKIDRPEARPGEVLNAVSELFLDLVVDPSQLDFPVVYTSARNGTASLSLGGAQASLQPLFETIVAHIPSPDVLGDDEFEMMISQLAYDQYMGPMVIGKVKSGRLHPGEEVHVYPKDQQPTIKKILKLFTFEGLQRLEIDETSPGDIIAIAGIDTQDIGTIVAQKEEIDHVDGLKIEEPTISIQMLVNNSPFSGREGKFFTSRHISDRLRREVKSNLSLKVTPTDNPDVFDVAGRGELHLTILFETMRREGYEFQVGMPKAILKHADGRLMEPIEELTIEVTDEYFGRVMEKIGPRRGDLLHSDKTPSGLTRLVFSIPSRGIIGLRSELLLETKGNIVLHHQFTGYDLYKGDLPSRKKGVQIAKEQTAAVAYALWFLQERGPLFVAPGDRVYGGMIVGVHNKETDIVVNPGKKKHLSNIRAAGSDEAIRLVPPMRLTLEYGLGFIEDDELLEITPLSIRLRKKILDHVDRKRFERRSEQEIEGDE
ncbi:MAG: translational GTPase TypA [Deltaproteobacteria bacterium]|nr:translational GTPase TypA [Deltaproteobacteria bacterium]MCL5277275.1 translational GTPase TypA [Deltaproteobacteria bacterium]